MKVCDPTIGTHPFPATGSSYLGQVDTPACAGQLEFNDGVIGPKFPAGPHPRYGHCTNIL